MNIAIIILAEFLFISLLILFLFKLRGKLGLAPLYILLGSVQYLQANIGSTVSFKLFNTYSIYPGSVILFSAVLFATLLIYIKEGVVSTRALIFGIIIGNAALSVLFGITFMQEGIAEEIAGISANTISVFKINYRIFIVGTIILLLDFFLLAIVYQFLINKLRRLPLFVVIFLSLFLILMFDGIAFTTGVYYNTPGYTDALISHLIGKSISAFLFSLMLYAFIRFIDKRKSPASFIAGQNADVFSIIKFRKAYGSATERKLASQLEVTLSNISDAFVSLDKDWNYTYANNKAGELFGRKADDLIGKHIWTEFPEGVGQPFHKAYYQAMETQKTQYLLEYYPPFDKWFENKIYPSPDGLTIYFSDVTAVKKAEDERQKLISLIETTNDFIGLATLEGKPIFLNENGRKLVGLTADEDISGFNITQFFPEEYKDTVIKEQLRVIIKDGLWTGEVFMQHFKTGKQIPVLMSGFLIRDENTDQPIAIGNVATDISLRKKAEEQIVKSEKYLDNIINNIGDPVFVKDEQSRLLLVNDAFCKIFGLSRADIIGKTLAEEVPRDQIESFLRIDREVIATGIENINEELLTVRDGKTLTISTRKTRFIDESGNKFLIATIRDFTERKHAEIALKESEEKFSKAFQSGEVGKAILNSERRIIEVNETMASMVETTRGLLLGKTVEESGILNFDKQQNTENNERVWQKFSESGYVKDFEVVITTLSGKKIHTLVSFEILHLNREDHVLATVADITAKKKAEEQILKTSEELRLLMQHLQNVREEERKRIGREIHDDLGQQLTAMKMYAVWINNRITKEQPLIKEKLAGILELLDGSNLSMRKILNELRVGILDNEGLIDGLKWLCQQFEESTSMELDFTTSLDKVKVNEQAEVCVFRILQESLNNIAKHAEAKKVTIEVTMADKKLIMIVADDGKGFEMDNLPTTNSFGILGMKERISAIKGEFSLQSVRGKGTELKITVPV